MAQLTATPTPGTLTEEEVRTRLSTCGEITIVEELYVTGQNMLKDSIDRIKTVETKATSFAAYGTALVTLLVSTASSWANLGNVWTLWIALCAATCALMCTVCCVRALVLRKFEVASQDEWLDAECLAADVTFLKKYRILSMWGAIASSCDVQADKAKNVQRGEKWIRAAVAYLVVLLLHLASVRTCIHVKWLALGQWSAIHGDVGLSSWKFLNLHIGFLRSLGGWGLGIGLLVTMALVAWRSRVA